MENLFQLNQIHINDLLSILTKEINKINKIHYTLFLKSNVFEEIVFDSEEYGKIIFKYFLIQIDKKNNDINFKITSKFSKENVPYPAFFYKNGNYHRYSMGTPELNMQDYDDYDIVEFIHFINKYKHLELFIKRDNEFTQHHIKLLFDNGKKRIN